MHQLGEFAKTLNFIGYFSLDYEFFLSPRIIAISWPFVFLQAVAGTIASYLVGMIWFSSSGLGRIWWSYTYPNKKYGECTGPAEGYGIRERGVDMVELHLPQ